MLEDSAVDAALLEREMRRGGLSFDTNRVETEEAFVAQLDAFDPNLIVSDFNLPAFDGMQALAIVRERSPRLPFILVSGHIGEDSAAEALKMGATDFILKDRVGRLVPCIQRALRDAEDRAEYAVGGTLPTVCRGGTQRHDVDFTVADGKIEMANGQTEAMFGYSAMSYWAGRSKCWFPNGCGRAARAESAFLLLAAAVAADRNGTRPVCPRRDGSEFPAEIGLNPIETEDGVLVLSVIVDITERRQLERKEAQQRQDLERSECAIFEEFASMSPRTT